MEVSISRPVGVTANRRTQPSSHPIYRHTHTHTHGRFAAQREIQSKCALDAHWQCFCCSLSLHSPLPPAPCPLLLLPPASTHASFNVPRTLPLPFSPSSSTASSTAFTTAPVPLIPSPRPVPPHHISSHPACVLTATVVPSFEHRMHHTAPPYESYCRCTHTHTRTHTHTHVRTHVRTHTHKRQGNRGQSECACACVCVCARVRQQQKKNHAHTWLVESKGTKKCQHPHSLTLTRASPNRWCIATHHNAARDGVPFGDGCICARCKDALSNPHNALHTRTSTARQHLRTCKSN